MLMMIDGRRWWSMMLMMIKMMMMIIDDDWWRWSMILMMNDGRWWWSMIMIKEVNISIVRLHKAMLQSLSHKAENRMASLNQPSPCHPVPRNSELVPNVAGVGRQLKHYILQQLTSFSNLKSYFVGFTCKTTDAPYKQPRNISINLSAAAVVSSNTKFSLRGSIRC